MKVRSFCTEKIGCSTITKFWLIQVACFLMLASLAFSPPVACALDINVPAFMPNYIETDGDWMVWLTGMNVHAYQFSTGAEHVLPELSTWMPDTSNGYVVYSLFDNGGNNGSVIVRSLTTDASWTVGRGMHNGIDWPWVAWVDNSAGIRIRNMLTSQEVLVPDTGCENVSVSGNWVIWERYSGPRREVRSYNIFNGVTATVDYGSCPAVNGNWAVWRTGDSAITAGNLMTGERRNVRIPEGASDPQWPMISGSRVSYWGATGDTGIYVYNIETDQLQKIANDGCWASIDDNKVSYCTFDPYTGAGNIRVVDIGEITPPDNHPPVGFAGKASTAGGVATPILLSASDADGEALTYRIVSSPSHGSLSRISGNKVVYTANSGYIGTDSFTFAASDGVANSDPARIDVNVIAAGTPIEASITEGNAVAVTAGQVSVSFENVTGTGTLEVTQFEPKHEGPANFRLIPNLYFDIHPAVTFTGIATVTVAIPVNYFGDITKLKVFHWKGNGWETIEPVVNTVTRTATFTTTSFSDYAFGEPIKNAVSVPASSGWSIGLVVVCILGLIGFNRISVKECLHF